jgi:hypothetical protein
VASGWRDFSFSAKAVATMLGVLQIPWVATPGEVMELTKAGQFRIPFGTI